MLATTLVVAMALSDRVVAVDTVLGTGAVVKRRSEVTIAYKAWLQSDGTVFDSTENKPPFTFTVGEKQVISGLDQAIQRARVGGSRMIVIPPRYGYGNREVGPIPKNATLVFDVKILRVEPEHPEIEVQDLQPGDGESAAEGDTIDVHYTGTFLNGTKFDSSKDRGTPLAVTIGKTGLIKGFTQGLVGMKVGGVRKVTIPYQLAYGEQGRPPVIPAKSTLVFELELVKLTKASN